MNLRLPILIISFSVFPTFAMDKAKEKAAERADRSEKKGLISFFEAYLDAGAIPDTQLTSDCFVYNHYLKGPRQTFSVKYAQIPGYLAYAQKTILDLYQDGKTMQAIANLLAQGNGLNLEGRFCMQLQSLYQFHFNADLGDEHTDIKKNRAAYKAAWESNDREKIRAALVLKLYPDDAPYVPLIKRIGPIELDSK